MKSWPWMPVFTKLSYRQWYDTFLTSTNSFQNINGNQKKWLGTTVMCHLNPKLKLAHGLAGSKYKWGVSTVSRSFFYCMIYFLYLIYACTRSESYKSYLLIYQIAIKINTCYFSSLASKLARYFKYRLISGKIVENYLILYNSLLS